MDREQIVNEIKVDLVQKIREDVAIHFGTYTDKDMVKISDVAKLIYRITEEILENNE